MLKIKKNDTIDYIFSLLSSNSYLVGGYLRDELLNVHSFDLDFVTDIKPEILKNILPYSSCFLKTGNFTFKKDDYHITITTMRKEGEYKDYRHPSYIEFISDRKIDFKRRDFTINALYMNNRYELLDESTCTYDINNHLLKMIGDPYIRLKEDPLRIIRAYRFIKKYDLKVEPILSDALKEDEKYIIYLKKEKIIEEINKSSDPDFIKNKLKGVLNELEIY